MAKEEGRNGADAWIAQNVPGCDKGPEAQKYMIRRQDVIDELMTWDGHCITDAEEWHLRQVIGSIKSIPGGEI